jgi:hypothetical protein
VRYINGGAFTGGTDLIVGATRINQGAFTCAGVAGPVLSTG